MFCSVFRGGIYCSVFEKPEPRSKNRAAGERIGQGYPGGSLHKPVWTHHHGKGHIIQTFNCLQVNIAFLMKHFKFSDQLEESFALQRDCEIA